MKKRWVISISTLTFLVIGFGFSVFFMPDRFIQPTKQSQIDHEINNKGYLKRDTIIVFYQPGCADCRKIGLNILLNESANQQTKYLNVDTQKLSNRRYLNQFKVTNTPTIVRFNRGKFVKYTGTNKRRINHLMKKSGLGKKENTNEKV